MAVLDQSKKNKKKKKIKKVTSTKPEKGGTPKREELYEGEGASSLNKKRKLKKEKIVADTEMGKLKGEQLHEGKEASVLKERKKLKKQKATTVENNADIGSLNGEELCEHEEPSALKKKRLKKRRTAAVDDDVGEKNINNKPLRGMKKWLLDYHGKRPGLDVLMKQIDDFIVDHEARVEQERKEREAAAAAEGWTVVVHHKGRKKTVDADSGIAVGSIAEASARAKNAKKKSKEADVAFYRFQRREARRNEILELQNKFEEDKKRIAQMKAARKFCPY